MELVRDLVVTGRRAAVSVALTLALVGCAGGPSDEETGVYTRTASATPGTLSAPAAASFVGGPDVSGADVASALQPLFGVDHGETCPLVDVDEMMGSSAAHLAPVEVTSDATSIGCVIRPADDPRTALSVRATTDVASVEASLADDEGIVAWLEPLRVGVGTLRVRCQSLVTEGSGPERCDGTWVANDGQLAIITGVMWPGQVDIEATAVVAERDLREILATFGPTA